MREEKNKIESKKIKRKIQQDQEQVWQIFG